MEYREAVCSDIEVLVNLRIDMLCEESILSENQKNIIKTNTNRFFTDGFKIHSVVSWVALHQEAIVGMGCVNFFTLPPNDWCPNGKSAYLGNMYTMPNFRRMGIASKLLSYLIDEAKTRQCQRVLLHTTDMGKDIYIEHGFEDSPTAMALYPFGIIPTI